MGGCRRGLILIKVIINVQYLPLFADDCCNIAVHVKPKLLCNCDSVVVNGK